MDAMEGRTGAYSEGPPWLFTGRALYQLHLVKAEVAQRFVPPELKLVQAFGYTLGGLYLARYNGSPAGVFDELVVIAGIVWNPPTSCAWAAKVLVSSEEARDHGRKEVGLPSQFAQFSQTCSPVWDSRPAWWDLPARWKQNRSSGSHSGQSKAETLGFKVEAERENALSLQSLCHIALPHDTVIKSKLPRKWSGPSIKMSLPSFSGKTKQQPELLKYSCDLRCSVRLVPAAVVTSSEAGDADSEPAGIRGVQEILLSKPLLAMHFDNMIMAVEAPLLVSTKAATSYSTKPSLSQPAYADQK